MMRQKHCLKSLICSVAVLIGLLFSSLPAYAQETTTTGSVVASSVNTLTVNTGGGQYQLFVYGRNARKPDSLPIGAQVRVVSTPGNEPGLRVASSVTVVQGTGTAPAPADQGTVPADISRLERDIERGLRRYQAGIRAGVALDPELVLIGAQAQVGPFFRSDVFFRPVAEFGIGEVTTMFTLSGDMIYRLPFSSPQDRWSTYVGAGIGLNLIHQNFDMEEDGRRVDFGDFHSDTVFNILGGARRRSGMFFEMKTSIYAGPSPTLRMTVGYTF